MHKENLKTIGISNSFIYSSQTTIQHNCTCFTSVIAKRMRKMNTNDCETGHGMNNIGKLNKKSK